MMKIEAARIQSLTEACTALLEREARICDASFAALNEWLTVMQTSTADPRFPRLAAQLKELRERVALVTEMARADFLTKIAREAESLSAAEPLKNLLHLLAIPVASSTAYGEALLDTLIEMTGAERGFVLFYLPESTEADLIAVRNYQTTNLALEEFEFSRTLLRDVFETGAALLIADASQSPAYAHETSVIKLQIKSVLAAPLCQSERLIGALYLENNAQPDSFTEDHLALTEAAAQIAVFALHQARLLPVAFAGQSRIFLDSRCASTEIIGRDVKIQAVMDVISRIADSPAAVLIEGESGTGKELVARALHYQSARKGRPFIAINCAAIPETLLESELFGHERGAFTGATERYIGRIEQGDGGTVFLDEISELAYPLQAKLLRFLQANEFDRLGGKQPVKVNVRIVSATSKDLKRQVADGKFQEALYYRLHVIPIPLPALRDHKQDIPLLIEHFLGKFAAIYQKPVRLTEAVLEHLQNYAFPGNVRELENLIHRLVALTGDGVICLGDLPEEVLPSAPQRISLQKEMDVEWLSMPLTSLEDLRRRRQEIRRLLKEKEQQLIARTLEETEGNLTAAAQRLGMHRITLHKLLRRNPENHK